MLDGFVPWPEDFVKKYKKAGYWEDLTLGDVFNQAVERYGPRVALVYGDQKITYEQLGERAIKIAYQMIKLGLKPYDRLVMNLPNIPELPYVYYGSLLIGVIPIMSLVAHRWAEISHFARTSDALAHAIPAQFGKFDFQTLAQEVRAQVPSVKITLVAGRPRYPDMISMDDLLAAEIDLEEAKKSIQKYRPDPMEPAVLQLSGGTTGVPKLIPRTHNDYHYNSKQNARVCGVDKNTVLLIQPPLAHNFALSCPGMTGVLLNGGRVILTTDVSPEEAFRLIEKEKVTNLPIVPALLYRWLDDPSRKKYDLSSLKCFWIGGNKPEPDLLEKGMKELGCDLQQVLGMAEGPLFWTRLDDPLEVKLNTQGKLMCPDDEFKILGGDDRPVPPGQAGELCCRGPYTIRGYYRALEHNKKAFTPDGFYRSGDLVKLHPSGNVIVVGRIKDCINRGGEKINAEEVEGHISLHPSVLNAACVGMPDKILYERICAFVVLKEGAILSLKDLNDFLEHERKIAKFKLPERLEIISEMPLSNVGKMDKKVLRDVIVAKLKEEGLA